VLIPDGEKTPANTGGRLYDTPRGVRRPCGGNREHARQILDPAQYAPLALRDRRRHNANDSQLYRPPSMYVCICNAITDHEIRSAVSLGARSLSDLQSTLGVATCCGRCADCARAIVGDASAQMADCACPGGDD
jgi:bacterioferritin-associated ferredoxin